MAARAVLQALISTVRNVQRTTQAPFVTSELHVITSAGKVMFSSASVCLFVGLRKNYGTDLHDIRWNGGTWATEETNRFWW